MKSNQKYILIPFFIMVAVSTLVCQSNKSKPDMLSASRISHCDSVIRFHQHIIDSLTERISFLNKKQLTLDSLKHALAELEPKLSQSIMATNACEREIRLLKEKFSLSYKVSGNEAARVLFNRNEYDYYKVNLENSQIKFFWKNESGANISSLKNLQSIVEKDKKTKLLFATNAGMYTPARAPQGLFIQNRKILVKVDRKKEENGNFYLQPNGIFFIDTLGRPGIFTTDEYNDTLSSKLLYATQSGPMLVINGVINSKFKAGSDNLNIRSGVGITKDNLVVFAISNKPVNFYDFAGFFKNHLKCDAALYLDGAISEMYLPELLRFDDGGGFGPIIGVTK